MKNQSKKLNSQPQNSRQMQDDKSGHGARRPIQPTEKFAPSKEQMPAEEEGDPRRKHQAE